MTYSPTAPFRKVFLCALLFGLFAVTVTGCGGKKDGKGDATVTGTVKYDGKPLPGGQVNFLSEEAIATKTMGVAGQIESDGTYKIMHAPVGPVKIIVTGPTRSSDASVKTVPIQIPVRYQDKGKSGLTFTVVEGANTKDLDLTK